MIKPVSRNIIYYYGSGLYLFAALKAFLISFVYIPVLIPYLEEFTNLTASSNLS